MENPMKLGAFSISLAVKNLEISRDFYQKLGFTIIGGELAHKYLILKNESTVIGLFEGLFEKNILTFNPGWDQDCQNLPEYTDVRELAKKIKEQGFFTEQEALPGESGPGSFVLTDPDGNPILIDQHR